MVCEYHFSRLTEKTALLEKNEEKFECDVLISIAVFFVHTSLLKFLRPAFNRLQIRYHLR